MGISEIFWGFFILSMLQPVLRKKMQEIARRRMIAQIETTRGSRVILLVHRQETMSLLGFPVLRYIDIHDSEEVLHAIQMTDSHVPIDLVLHTPGGLVLAAVHIARALHEHTGKVMAFVPHYAMSGGTLIALAADEIVMSRHAVLGPVDPQVGQSPAASILKVLEKKPMAEIDDMTLILADQAEKAIRQVQESVLELLAQHYPAERATHLARVLTEGTWTHDYPISVTKAQELGLPVSDKMPQEVLQLMQLFPQPAQHRVPSVEYLPGPRHAPETPGSRRRSKGSLWCRGKLSRVETVLVNFAGFLCYDEAPFSGGSYGFPHGGAQDRG